MPTGITLSLLLFVLAICRQADDLPEMVSVNRKCDCHGEEPGLLEKCPEKQLPVVDAFLVEDAQTNDRTRECQQILEIERRSESERFEFFQECFDAGIVILWRVQCVDDRLVSFMQ